MTHPVWVLVRVIRMAERRIFVYPQYEKSLRKPSKPVTDFSKKTKKLIEDLKDTVLTRPAVGLAAPQIGVHRRAVVVRLGQTEEGDGELSEPMVLINPEIVSFGPPIRGYDACLSIPYLYGYTDRPEELVVRGINEEGEEAEWVFRDMDARVVAHEIDHLDGVLFIDHIVDFRRDLFVMVENEEGEMEYVPFTSYLLENPEDDRWQRVMQRTPAGN